MILFCLLISVCLQTNHGIFKSKEKKEGRLFMDKFSRQSEIYMYLIWLKDKTRHTFTIMCIAWIEVWLWSDCYKSKCRETKTMQWNNHVRQMPFILFFFHIYWSSTKTAIDTSYPIIKLIYVSTVNIHFGFLHSWSGMESINMLAFYVSLT